MLRRAIDTHGHEGSATYGLDVGHATALTVDEGSHTTLTERHEHAVDIYLANDTHGVLILIGVNGPSGSLATYLHLHAQRLQNLIVALKAHGDIIVAYGHRRHHLETQRFLRQGSEVTNGIDG